MNRIAILYPCDPVGFVPSGIDTFIRGLLKWAPADLEYTLFGATTDTAARPIGQVHRIPGLYRECGFLPLVTVDHSARRSRVPLTLRYISALRRRLRDDSLAKFEILDFHRPEPIVLFRRDPRPKNLVLHQDMTVIRGKHSDIKWRHFPWLYDRLERYLFRHVAHVFCVRQSAIERYQARYAGRGIGFEFIPTWVDMEAFAASDHMREDSRRELRKKLGFPGQARLLTFVGRLDRQKNPLLLVDAFRSAAVNDPSLYLVIVGDGALRSEVEQGIESYGISERVRLLGAQPPSRVAGVLQASDLFVLSSAYEGMPIAVLEALAAGLPVVSTDVGEIRLVVMDGVNGAVATAQTPEALGAAISSALAKLDTLRGAPCRESVRAYGPGAVLGRIYQHHRRQAQLLGARRSP